MPNAVLTSLLSGSETDSLIGVVNLTPYDGNLEISLLKRGLAKPEHTYRSLSFANDMTVSQHCEKVCAFHLFEDIMWMNIVAQELLTRNKFQIILSVQWGVPRTNAMICYSSVSNSGSCAIEVGTLSF